MKRKVSIGLFLIGLGLLIGGINKEKVKLPKYKVYYEYNVIDKDTIPIDTIYIETK